MSAHRKCRKNKHDYRLSASMGGQEAAWDTVHFKVSRMLCESCGHVTYRFWQRMSWEAWDQIEPYKALNWSKFRSTFELFTGRPLGEWLMYGYDSRGKR